MKQKNRTDQRNDDEFFQQFVTEILYGTFNQSRTVVHRYYLDTRRETRPQLLQFRLHSSQRCQRIASCAHDDHAAHCLAFAIELADTPAHFRAELDAGHIVERYRYAGECSHQWNCPEIVEALKIAGG